MTKGEEGLNPLGVVPAVAHEEALRVVDLVGEAVHGRWRGAGGQVRLALREGDGELAGGVDVSEEEGGDRLCAADPWVPRLEHRRDLVDPGHQDRASILEDDDGPR